jgi:hypothetical protein
MVLWNWDLMPGVVPGSCGGILGHPFEMPCVREYRSIYFLGKIATLSLVSKVGKDK